MDKRKKAAIIAYSILAVAFLYVIEQIVVPGYALKSFSKIMVFLFGAAILQNSLGTRRAKSFFLQRKASASFIKIALVGSGAFAAVLAAYALLVNLIDPGAVTGELEESLNINSENFIAVGIYIIAVNAALEEFFFRGFLFLNLKGGSARERFFAYIYSSFLFSVYHLSIFKTWFDIKLIAAAILGLFVAGNIFNYMDQKNDTIIFSYVVHACGDAAIIFIGLKMFGLA